ncbi:MAG: BlaI/MecI/CopY family transcriptional regulator [Micromonosporaceae bacterium]|nr:BlaI/MecI/CopY family transcriptional regulator [Micromonosporaceae bacterium]
MDDRRRARGSLEHEVVAVLAAASGPMRPAQVRDALGDDLAYTTVMTVLARLHQKGSVTRIRSGRAYAYQPAGDDAEVTARRMRRLLDAGENRARVLSRFVEALSPADEAVIAELVHRPRPEDRQ